MDLRRAIALGSAAFAVVAFLACGGDDAASPSATCSRACDGGAPADSAPGSATNANDAGGGQDIAEDASSSGAGLVCSSAAAITSKHRFSAQMYGGWGPHLGHRLRSAANEEWFVDDTGSDVEVNAGLAYYKRVGGAWTLTGSNAFPGNVQQNTGSLMAGNVIFTYGVDVTNERMTECTFDTSTLVKGCANLPFDTGALSNYTGATISKSGSKVVWWTNTSGSFSYIYDFGGGWNGPVTSTLPGYADFSYVYGRLAPDNSHFELHGAAAKGQGGASVGYDALYASTVLGTVISNWQLVAPSTIALETWLDPLGGAHFFTLGASVLYSYKPKDGTLAAQPALTDASIVSARVVESATTAYLVLSFGDGSVRQKAVKLAEITGPIDWAAIPSVDVTVPAGLGSITLYPESAMYQNNPLQAAFAMDGYANQGTVLDIGCE